MYIASVSYCIHACYTRIISCIQGSPQDNLSSGYTLAKVLSKCFKHRFQRFLPLWVVVKQTWVVVKITEWWLELTTPNQCGENPVYPMYDTCTYKSTALAHHYSMPYVQLYMYSVQCIIIVGIGRKCALSVRWWWVVELPLTSTALLSPKESAVLSFIFSTSRCFTFFMAKDRGRHSMHIHVHVHVQCHCYCQGFSKHTKYKSLVSIMYFPKDQYWSRKHVINETMVKIGYSNQGTGSQREGHSSKFD